MKFDFGGYATKADLKCADGRTIKKDAFKENDGKTVPLVWQHQRNNPSNVLGHAYLENRKDGVYAYCKFNDTDSAKDAKTLVRHGDITSLSIYANQLKESGGNVYHGLIREVSLVLAGANPGATIDNIYFEHSEDSESDEAIIYTGLDLSLTDVEKIEHAEEGQNGSESEDDSETVKDVFDSMTEKQKKVVYAMIAHALSDDEEDDMEQSDEDENDIEHEEGDDNMNVFEKQGKEANTNELSHDEMMAIISDANRYGSLKTSVLEHGITNIDVLFPEAQFVTPTPEMIMRDQAWVSKIWNGVRKSPFSRIKSAAANLTMTEARAKGYIKGKAKVEEQFSLLKRVTTPQTVYKKQALDRDDLIDITSFDVVAWMKAEMRLMLNEELARAILVGDGRMAGADDKINETNIRPIYTDAETYTIYYKLAGSTADNIIDGANRARKDYKGSGSPALFTTSDTLTTLLLSKDTTGRRLYNTTTELASALRVSEIVEVPVMENLSRTVTVSTGESSSTTKTMNLVGIIVNPIDYVVGADRGGAVSMFDDFDIDYNKEKYLIETRCSGALYRPYSAIILEVEAPAG